MGGCESQEHRSLRCQRKCCMHYTVAVALSLQQLFIPLLLPYTSMYCILLAKLLNSIKHRESAVCLGLSAISASSRPSSGRNITLDLNCYTRSRVMYYSNFYLIVLCTLLHRIYLIVICIQLLLYSMCYVQYSIVLYCYLLLA